MGVSVIPGIGSQLAHVEFDALILSDYISNLQQKYVSKYAIVYCLL